MSASARFPAPQGPARGPWQSSTSQLTGVGEPARHKASLWGASLWAPPRSFSVSYSMGLQQCVAQAVVVNGNLLSPVVPEWTGLGCAQDMHAP